MKCERTIERPIFVIGCGRSGTTLLYELLCGHPDVAWFSTYSQRCGAFPWAITASRLHEVGGLGRHIRRYLPQPAEGHRLWDYCKPVADSPGDPPLTEDDVEPGDAARARDIVAKHLRYQGKTRFVNKNTRNTRRIGFLDAIFNDALFIHIVRDPRATVNSLLTVDFWPDLQVWCEKKVTPRQWEAAGNDPADLAAQLWVAEVQRALDDSARLSADRYLQLRYEDLTGYPDDMLAGILAFCGLESSERFSKYVSGFRLTNMNFKYAAQLSAQRIERIDEVVYPVARRLGYRVKSTRPQVHRTVGNSAVHADECSRMSLPDTPLVGRPA